MPHIYSHPVGDQESETAGPEGSRTGKRNVKKKRSQKRTRELWGEDKDKCLRDFFTKRKQRHATLFQFFDTIQN